MATVMNSAKEMLDFWTNTQKKIVDNWVDSTRQLQDAAKEGKVLEQASEMYQNWFDNQKEILSEAVEKGKTISAEHMPEQMQKLMEQQAAFTKKWMETISQMTDRQMQMARMVTEGKDVKQAIMDSYKSWFDAITDMMNDVKMAMPFQTTQEAFEQMMNGAKSYFGAYELWKPFMDMLQHQNYDVNQYFKMTNMEEWQKMAQHMFAYNPSQFGFLNMEKMNEQTRKLMEQYRSMMEQNPFFAPYKEFFNQYSELIPKSLTGFTPQASEEIYERMQRLYAPFYKLVPPSKEKEMLSLFADMQKTFLRYQTKMSEMNVIVGDTVRKAAEEYMKGLFDAAKEGQAPQSYNEFYINWLNTLENRMIEVFKTDEFSKIQGEVLALQLDLKANFNKAMEQMLSPYPIALNSQLDELAKQVHDLKAKVRQLEKNQANASVSHQEETENSEEKAKTSARRKASAK